MKLAGLTPCRRQSQDWRNRRVPDDSSRPRAALAARSDDWSDRGMGQGEKRSGGCRRWPCRHYSSRQRHLLAPIARPGKIMAIGLNKADLEKPAHQAWFCKHANSVNAPFAPSQIPKASPAVNYEIELVLVIGKGGRHITGVDAPRHIFCNCVSNDVTVRDWQFRTSQWALGKSFDTYGPLGPWIRTSTSAKPAS